MITKMKKLTFLVYHKEYEEFLNSLRELGVVHIVEKQQGAADNTELQDNIRLSNRLAATLKLLQNQKHEKNAVIATEGGTVSLRRLRTRTASGRRSANSTTTPVRRNCSWEPSGRAYLYTECPQAVRCGMWPSTGSPLSMTGSC